MNCNNHLATLSKIHRYIGSVTAIKIYKVIVMSRIQYGLIFTINATISDRSRIQKLQNRALRICTLTSRYVSNLSLHVSTNVMPIYLRSKLDLLVLMFKKVVKNRNLEVALENSVRVTSVRSAPVIEVVMPKSGRFAKSTSYVEPTTWHAFEKLIHAQINC